MLKNKPNTIVKVNLYQNGIKLLSRYVKAKCGNDEAMEMMLIQMAHLQQEVLSLYRYNRNPHDDGKTYREAKARVKKRAGLLTLWMNIYLENLGMRDEMEEQLLGKIVGKANSIDPKFEEHQWNKEVYL